MHLIIFNRRIKWKKNDPETFSLISYAHCWSFLVNFLFWYVNQYSFNWRIKRENWPKSFIRYFYYRGRQGPARAGSPFLYLTSLSFWLCVCIWYLYPGIAIIEDVRGPARAGSQAGAVWPVVVVEYTGGGEVSVRHRG